MLLMAARVVDGGGVDDRDGEDKNAVVNRVRRP
jgi:hypothetical protein